MLKPIECDNCRKIVESLPFQVQWKVRTERCKSCGHEDEEYRHFEFCSAKCLRLWSKRFDGHEHRWELGKYGGATLGKNRNITDVMAYCTICHENNFHCKDKKLIKKYTKQHQGYLEAHTKIRKL